MTKINYLLILSLFILMALPFTLQAQELRGRVLNAQTQQPLRGVTVSVDGKAFTLSGETGYFEAELTSVNAPVILSYIGFKTDTVYWSEGYDGSVIEVLLQPKGAVLQEVQVQGYETNRPLLQTAGAISLIEREVITRFDESSLVRAVNTVPGVRMEERAPASYRLSIRGSSLRSPYGIRNVKVYYDGIPFTEANGTTALNLLDAGNIGRMEILKGPTASIYGAGTGGTVLLEPRRAAPGEASLEVGATFGSYGFQRQTATASIGAENSSILVQYTRQTYDGYRQQSAIDRDVLLISSQFTPTDKRTISANLIYSNLYYELPGGLTQEQYAQDPRQARGGQFGSVAQNASLDLEGINVGLKQEYRFSEDFRNTTSVYGLHKFKDNPFNTDYERNANQEFGGRTSFVLDASLGSIATAFTLGGEFQRGFEVARTYDNNGGTTGNLRTDDEVVSKAGFLFAQAEFELPSDIIATAALSLNDTRYEITRLQQVASGNYIYKRDFEAVLSPRVALLKQLTDKISIHASVSSGFSPPTEEEILTSDGQLNEALEAEKGTNYEVGVRGFMLADKLSFDVVGFYFNLNETIVSRQDVSSVAVFRNVGSTDQKGLETSIGYTLLDEPTQPLSLLKVWGSYTYSHFRFKEYQQNETDYSGNDLTGVAPHAATAGIDLTTRFGLYFNLTANYVDEIPLNDENTVYADSYLVAGARLGLKRQLGAHFGLEVFGGVDNLTDEKYSLGNDLNAFGGRYFQAAPDRNYYTGLSLKYTL
ncbi:TonB-dependent receptor domain-containing protein [Pontibacter akesuensis]|uniref:Iron complex outermembrane recepter protein n=1 Tax=Pontibacter akesuensis TaxID=388950 RepID=A0A1I7HQ12_9BACT|nr:TonB-dependent receptor [Pontibacter akesuensis]GHA63019.1 outer membrane protein [Pontibacter akesuensis]SFU62844.1 iron complex outermembrane recepter protein [Pontibacter akesuensis]